MNDLMARLTSRKFILAIVSGVFGAAAAAGIVPADSVARDIAIAGPLAFIGIEGVADMIERHQLSKPVEADLKDVLTSVVAAAVASAVAQAPNAVASSPAEPAQRDPSVSSQ